MLMAFLRFLFGGGGVEVFVKRVEVSREPDSSINLRERVVLVVTYVMSFVLLTSFSVIVLFVVLWSDREVPVILRDIFFGTLGYFAGAFVCFLRGSGSS